MPVKEIELALKNESGQLLLISDVLNASGIAIIALQVNTRGKQGSLRFVTNDHARALTVLQSRGYTVKINDVIACEIPGHQGGLNSVLKTLNNEKINVDYIYPCLNRLKKDSGTILIVGLSPGDRERAIAALKENWIRVLDEEFNRL